MLTGGLPKKTLTMELPGLIPGSQRFDNFHVYSTFYKKIRDHEVEVGILVPKNLRPGVHPVFVRFHGGGLVRVFSTFLIRLGTYVLTGLRDMVVLKLVCKLAGFYDPSK